MLKKVSNNSSFIVYLFLASDLFTTYLATPKLDTEFFYFTRLHGYGWPFLISFFFLNTLLVHIGYLWSKRLTYPRKNFDSGKFIRHYFTFSEKSLIKLFLEILFLERLFTYIFGTLNNYLSYVFKQKLTNNFFHNLSELYASAANKIEVLTGLPYLYFDVPVIVLTLLIYKLVQIYSQQRISSTFE